MPRALVVDDNDIHRETLKLMIDECGWGVVAKASLAAASEAAGEFQAVFVDLNLPDGNGMDYARGLTAGQPNRLVVVMSAVPRHTLAATQDPPPQVKLLSKPFTINQIREILELPPSSLAD